MDTRIITTPPHELHDLELAGEIADRYRAYGLEWMQPNIRTQDSFEQVLHARIERVQRVPEFSSESIVERLTKEFNNSRISVNSHVSDVDKLFNIRGQSAASEKFLKDMKLTRIDQILVLRGVVLATRRRRIEAARGTSGFRYSSKQEDLKLAATRVIHTMANNPVSLKGNGDEERLKRFTENYVTSYIAKLVDREVSVEQLPENYDRTSILGAMNLPIPFSRLREKQPDKTLDIFTKERYEDNDPEPYGFRAVRKVEIDPQRLAGLGEVQANLDDGSTSFTYFDTVRPFVVVDRPEEDMPNKKTRISPIPLMEVDDDAEEEDYVVLEIESTDEQGRTNTHVVAENNTKRNACYVLRQEVLDHWQDVFGISFKWENILIATKRAARQMGAKRMVHAKGSDVPKRVIEYLSGDGEEAVLDAFAFLFDGSSRKNIEKHIFFDDYMQPTKHNKLKPELIAKIQQSKELKAVWPLIRTHGYKATYKLLNSLEAHTATSTLSTSKEKTEDVEKNRKDKEDKNSSLENSTFSQKAHDLWSMLTAEVIETL